MAPQTISRRRPYPQPGRGHGFKVHVGIKRSRSRGWVRLRDANPHSLPRVRFNYMTDPQDW